MKKLKIEIAQIKQVPMDINHNLKNILVAVAEAKDRGVDILVLPELCVSGYVLGDRYEYDNFIADIQRANNVIKDNTDNIVVVWGSIVSDANHINEDGRLRKYNAALIAQNCKWVSNGILEGYIPKTNLPKYRIFDDARHFYPGYKLALEMNLSLDEFYQPFILNIKDKEYSLALAICEDIWEDEYNIKISEIYKSRNVDMLVDLSASPWTLGKWHARENMLRKRAGVIGAPILYVNCVGLQNNGKNLIWFDGESTFVNKKGEFVFRLNRNVEEYGIFEYDFINDLVNTELSNSEREDNISELYGSILSAAREFYSPFKKVVIGMSGGIDSAIAAAIISEAVGPKKLLAVNMPTIYNSNTTQDLAKLCAENLGIEYKVLPIQLLYEEQVKMLENLGLKNISMLTKENIQARIRGAELAAISSYYGGVFTNNGNKTEGSLNYFTLYGDAAGAAAILGDLWKGQIYELAKYFNKVKGFEAIPSGIINIIPSAELSEDQNVDEGKGDPIQYEYHDKLLRAFCEYRWDVEKVLQEIIGGTFEEKVGLDRNSMTNYFKNKIDFIKDLEWAWNNYNMEFKRVQLPPVLITSRRAFGFDRRDVIAAAHYTDNYYNLKQKFLTDDTLTLNSV